MESAKPISLGCNTIEREHSSEKEKPIIFLHGLGASKEHWGDIPRKVAEDTNRKVYVLDARNHGDSEWSEEFNYDLNVVDLIHFIEQVEAESVTLVGHSIGGITSIKTALKMPSKIDKIVVEDIGFTIPSAFADTVKVAMSLYDKALSFIPPGSTITEAKTFVDDFVFGHLPEMLKQAINIKENHSFNVLKQNSDGSFSYTTNLKGILNFVKNYDTTYQPEYKGLYDGPACFIYGRQSPFHVNEDAENIRALFPKAQFVGIEGASHTVHVDKPDLFTEALLKFLKE